MDGDEPQAPHDRLRPGGEPRSTGDAARALRLSARSPSRPRSTPAARRRPASDPPTPGCCTAPAVAPDPVTALVRGQGGGRSCTRRRRVGGTPRRRGPRPRPGVARTRGLPASHRQAPLVRHRARVMAPALQTGTPGVCAHPRPRVPGVVDSVRARGGWTCLQRAGSWRSLFAGWRSAGARARRNPTPSSTLSFRRRSRRTPTCSRSGRR